MKIYCLGMTTHGVAGMVNELKSNGYDHKDICGTTDDLDVLGARQSDCVVWMSGCYKTNNPQKFSRLVDMDYCVFINSSTVIKHLKQFGDKKMAQVQAPKTEPMIKVTVEFKGRDVKAMAEDDLLAHVLQLLRDKEEGATLAATTPNNAVKRAIARQISVLDDAIHHLSVELDTRA